MLQNMLTQLMAGKECGNAHVSHFLYLQPLIGMHTFGYTYRTDYQARELKRMRECNAMIQTTTRLL